MVMCQCPQGIGFMTYSTAEMCVPGMRCNEIGNGIDCVFLFSYYYLYVHRFYMVVGSIFCFDD